MSVPADQLAIGEIAQARDAYRRAGRVIELVGLAEDVGDRLEVSGAVAEIEDHRRGRVQVVDHVARWVVHDQPVLGFVDLERFGPSGVGIAHRPGAFPRRGHRSIAAR